MSKADLRVNVGADVGDSTEILKQDLKNIALILRRQKVPQVAVSVNVARTQREFQTQLQNIVKNLKLNANIGITGATGKGSKSSSSIPFSQFTDAEVSTRKMSAATALLTKEKLRSAKAINQEKEAHLKNINVKKQAIEQARLNIAKSRENVQLLREQVAVQKLIKNPMDKYRGSEGFFKVQENKARQLGIDPKSIETLERAKKIWEEIRDVDAFSKKDSSEQIQKLYEYEQALKDVVNQMRVLSSDKSLEKHYQSAEHRAQAHLAAVKNLTIQLQNYLKTNSRVLKNEKGQELSNILQDLLGGKYDTDTAGFDEIRNKVKQLQIELKAAGLEGQTMWERIGKAYQKFGGWMLVTHSLMQLKRAFTEMIKNVKEIDLQMTELKKVTEETDATYKRFLEGAAERAKILGSTISDVVRATAEFAKMGYSLEESSKLADAALVYKNVGDGINNIEEASSTVISTMKAFGIEASKSMEIIDKFNEVSNNFAASSKDIGLAMADAGAALASSGNTIDESIAMFVAMNEIIQDASKSSTALRTLATRIRNTAGKLQEMGEDAEGAAESTTKLQQQIKELTGVDIMLNPDTFKSTYQIMLEISKVWDKLTDKAKADVIRLLGGTRQASTLSALLSNMSTAQKVVETSMNSMGSALAENEKYLDSIQGRLTKMNSAFQALSQTVVNSDFLKVLITGATGAINVLDKIIQELGSLNVVIITTVASLAIFNEGFRAFYNANIASMFAGIAEVIQYKLVASLGLAKGAAIGLAQAFTVIAPIAILTGAIWLFKHLSEATERERQKIAELKQEYDNLNQSLEDNKNKLKEVEDRKKELYRLREEGIITQAEKDELDHLEKVNKELENQIKYEEALQKIKGKELEEKALKAGSRKTERSSYGRLRPDGSIEYENITPAEKLQENITLIKQYQQQLEELKKSRDNNTISAEEYEKQEKKINDALKSLITKSEELKNKLEEENEAYKGSTKEGTERKKMNLELINSWKELVIAIGNGTDVININSSAQNKNNETIQNLLSSTNTLASNTSKVTKEFERYQLISDLVNKKIYLTDAEMAKLIKDLPELEKKVSKTTKGWTLEASAMDIVENSILDLQTSYISVQNALTNTLDSKMASRIRSLGIELESIDTVAEAYEELSKTLTDDAGLHFTINELRTRKFSPEMQAVIDFVVGIGKAREKLAKAIEKINQLANSIGKSVKESKSSSPADKYPEKYELEINRYSALLQVLNDVENQLELNKTLQEQAGGKNIDLLNEEISLLEKKRKAINDITWEQKQEASELRNYLESVGVKFDEQGNVVTSTYDAIVKQRTAYINSLKSGDTRDTAIKDLELLKKRMDQYNDLILKDIPKNIRDMFSVGTDIAKVENKIIDTQLEQWKRLLDNGEMILEDYIVRISDLLKKTYNEEQRSKMIQLLEDAEEEKLDKLFNSFEREKKLSDLRLVYFKEGEAEHTKEIQYQIDLQERIKEAAHKEAERLRQLGYNDEHKLILKLKDIWIAAEKEKLSLLEQRRKQEIEIAEEGRDLLISLYEAYYDKLKDMEEERHDEVIRNIDKEIKKLEEKYDKEDYREKLAKKNKEIAKKQAELEALALDNSMEGLAKKAKLEEELEELLDEKNEMVEKNKRDEMRKTLEKAKEAENEKYKANMKSLEERSKQEAIYAEVVQMLTNETTGHIIDKYNEMAKVVGGKWDEISEKAKNYAKIVQSATQYQNPESAIRQENLAESNKVVQFRSFVEGMGATVDWDEKTGAVLVNGKVIDTSKFELRSDDRYYAKIKDIIEALKKAKVPNLNFDDGGVIVNAHKKERVLTPIQNKNFERLVELANNPNFIKAIDFSKFLIPKMNIPAFASNIGKSISIGQVNLNIPALPTDTADEVVRQVEKRFKIWINDVLK